MQRLSSLISATLLSACSYSSVDLTVAYDGTPLSSLIFDAERHSLPPSLPLDTQLSVALEADGHPLSLSGYPSGIISQTPFSEAPSFCDLFYSVKDSTFWIKLLGDQTSSYSLVFTADPTSVVAESDERNNSTRIPLSLQSLLICGIHSP